LWRIESVANPLTCIVQASAGPLGGPFLMASAQADNDRSQKRQQYPHALVPFNLRDAQTLNRRAGSRTFGWKRDAGTLIKRKLSWAGL
jgi:hypothetical protein